MASRNGNSNQLQRSTTISSSNLGLQSGSIRAGVPNAIPLSTRYLQPGMTSGFAPPLPMRRPTTASYAGRLGMGMGMGSYYSPYSRYPTSMYSPGYGGYRGGYGAYGGIGGEDSASSFIQMAEESTRPAFESIESVVEVVSSISMMLESTYHAVHSSYSAILGVVDQFSRLKDHLAQMLSILALLRGLRWLCLKVLYLLKLRKENPSDEAAWGAAAEAASGLHSLPPLPDKDRGSAWPFLMFVGLVIGAPWLMFKLLSKTVKKNPLETRVFRNEQGRLCMAIAAYDFKATRSDELSFSAGEKLYISPKSNRSSPNGWWFACNQKHETGLIPSTYLKTTKKQVAQQPGNQVMGYQPLNQVTGAYAGNQVPNLQPGNQVPVSQPGNQLSDSQPPREAFIGPEDANFNEAFDQSNDLIDNSSNQPFKFDFLRNSSFQPNNVRSENVSGGLPPKVDRNSSENVEELVTPQSNMDNVKNASVGVKDDKVPQTTSNNEDMNTP